MTDRLTEKQALIIAYYADPTATNAALIRDLKYSGRALNGLKERGLLEDTDKHPFTKPTAEGYRLLRAARAQGQAPASRPRASGTTNRQGKLPNKNAGQIPDQTWEAFGARCYGMGRSRTQILTVLIDAFNSGEITIEDTPTGLRLAQGAV